MFFLVEGKVKTYTLHGNGKSILLRVNYPLSVFGDVELLTDYKVACNVEAINRSVLIGIEFDKLKGSMCNDTNFLKFIIKNLSNKLYTISNSTSINLLYPLETRLSSYILSILNKDEQGSLDKKQVNIPKLTEIAPLLGTSYRNLNRVINKLEEKDIIQKNRSIIIIKNLKKLKELSQGNIYEI